MKNRSSQPTSNYDWDMFNHPKTISLFNRIFHFLTAFCHFSSLFSTRAQPILRILTPQFLLKPALRHLADTSFSDLPPNALPARTQYDIFSNFFYINTLDKIYFYVSYSYDLRTFASVTEQLVLELPLTVVRDERYKCWPFLKPSLRFLYILGHKI